MAGRSWRKEFQESFPRKFFKKDVSTAVHTPQRYLKLAKECMKSVDRMTSQSGSTSLQFNHGQCEYLAKKLKEAVHSAEEAPWPTSSAIDAECVEMMKLLMRTAKEVKSFIQGCRRDNWIQAAMVWANMSKTVCQLSYDMEFCRFLLPEKINPLGDGWRALTACESCLFTDSELVKEIVSRDQRALLVRLEAVNRSSNSSEQESYLARSLSSRLSHHSSESVQLSRESPKPVQLRGWEIHYSSLSPGQKLGSGAVGTVRKSIWLGEEVAEKMFYGSDHPSFVREVGILAGLAHPSIVPLIGYAMDGNRCFIVMELMDGDLSSLIEERMRQNPTYKVPFTDFEALDLMLQTAEGLLYLHENRVVHRDLKSHNILVKSRKDIDAKYIWAKVADFGLSKTKESSSSYSNLTFNTGTTRWMAPELMPPGEDDLTAKTSNHDPELKYPFKVDVYSFGMVCYEILSGKVPFSTTSSLREVKKMVLNGDRPILPDRCPHSLKTLIHSCWESEASRRPSFVDICKRLRRLKYVSIIYSGSRGNPGAFEAIRALELLTSFGYKNGFEKKYRVGKVLQMSRFSNISDAIEVSTGNRFAVKIKEKMEMADFPKYLEYVKREVERLEEFSGHENVVQFYDAFEDDDHIYVIMELCEGGDLLGRMKAKDYYPEKDAARIVRQMLNIAALCHLKGVVHGDMKPENFLFKSSREDSPLKAIGFRRFCDIKPGDQFCDLVRTHYYKASEAFSGDSRHESDAWSVGVITDTLLCGRRPFWAETAADLSDQVLANEPDFQREPWPSISSTAKDFVKSLLVTDLHMRLTAAQALYHPWFKVASVVLDPKPLGPRAPRNNTDSDAPWMKRNAVDMGVDGHLLHPTAPWATARTLKRAEGPLVTIWDLRDRLDAINRPHLKQDCTQLQKDTEIL